MELNSFSTFMSPEWEPPLDSETVTDHKFDLGSSFETFPDF